MSNRWFHESFLMLSCCWARRNAEAPLKGFVLNSSWAESYDVANKMPRIHQPTAIHAVVCSGVVRSKAAYIMWLTKNGVRHHFVASPCIYSLQWCIIMHHVVVCLHLRNAATALLWMNAAQLQSDTQSAQPAQTYKMRHNPLHHGKLHSDANWIELMSWVLCFVV